MGHGAAPALPSWRLGASSNRVPKKNARYPGLPAPRRKMWPGWLRSLHCPPEGAGTHHASYRGKLAIVLIFRACENRTPACYAGPVGKFRLDGKRPSCTRCACRMSLRRPPKQRNTRTGSSEIIVPTYRTHHLMCCTNSMQIAPLSMLRSDDKSQ